jgi:hypothetical protein
VCVEGAETDRRRPIDGQLIVDFPLERVGDCLPFRVVELGLARVFRTFGPGDANKTIPVRV